MRCVDRLPIEWETSVIVPVCKTEETSDCNNYSRISLLQTCYKVFINILLTRLNVYVYQIIGDYQCDLEKNRSMLNQIIALGQTSKSKWKFNWIVQQLLIEFRKTYDSTNTQYPVTMYNSEQISSASENVSQWS